MSGGIGGDTGAGASGEAGDGVGIGFGFRLRRGRAAFPDGGKQIGRRSMGVKTGNSWDKTEGVGFAEA